VTVTLFSSVAWHEAHHAASLCLSGLTPLTVRIDRPGDDLGQTTLDWTNHALDRRTAREALIAILLGLAVEGELQRASCEWPIKTERSKDARQAAILAEYLDLDDLAFMRACFDAAQRTRDPRFAPLVTQIANELERVELVTQPELIEMTKSVEENTHGR
jgi:hypothetical protein